MTQPIIYQRLEGATILASSVILYYHFHYSLLWFIVLLLIFDVSMVGYLISSKVGAHTYNLAHSLIAPPILYACGLVTGSHLIVGLALIWFAHIGMDRALGYGLKFPTSFHQTHLGPIGLLRKHSQNTAS